MDLARTLSMTALVEVHDEDELSRALDTGAGVIGVNQRDLHTFEVDHRRALTLGALIPAGVVAVAESGIRTADDVDSLARRRLPGRAGGGDPGPVGGPSGRGGRSPRSRQVSSVDADEDELFVKICGITSEADALLAVGVGASAVGFVFAPSPRQMAPAAVADIVKRLPHETVTVGVFRDEAPRRVIDIANQIGLQAVQLHGVESVEDTRWIASRTACTIKAFPAGHRNIERFEEYGAQTPDDRRGQPRLGPAVRLASGRGGDRPAPSHRVGWAPSRQRRGSHRPPSPVGRRCVQWGGSLARGQGSRKAPPVRGGSP